MGVAQRRVGDQQPLLLAHPRGELLRPEFLEACRACPWADAASGQCRCGSDAGTGCGSAIRAPSLLRTSGWPLTMTSRDVGQQLASPGPAAAASWNSSGVSSMNRVVHAAGEERRVRDQVDEERDVRLHAADAELLQAALHAAGGVDEAQAVGRHLHQQRIVERRDDRAAERGAGVEPDAHAAGRAVVR